MLETVIANAERPRSYPCELSAPSAEEKLRPRTYLSPTVAAARHRRPRYAEARSGADHETFSCPHLYVSTCAGRRKNRIRTLFLTFALPFARTAAPAKCIGRGCIAPGDDWVTKVPTSGRSHCPRGYPHMSVTPQSGENGHVARPGPVGRSGSSAL